MAETPRQNILLQPGARGQLLSGAYNITYFMIYKCLLIDIFPKRKRLFAGTVPANKNLSAGTVPANKGYLPEPHYFLSQVTFFTSPLRVWQVQPTRGANTFLFEGFRQLSCYMPEQVPASK